MPNGCTESSTHTRTHTQARRRRSVRVNALVQGDRKLSPLPSSLPSPSFSFSLASAFLSLSLSLYLPPSSFVLSRTRTDGGLSRNDLCVPMCRNNRPLREKTRVVGTIVSRRGGGGDGGWWGWWWHNHQSQSFGEKAAGYLTSCYTPPPGVYDPLTAIMQPNLSYSNRISRYVRLFRWEDLSLSGFRVNDAAS